MSNMPRTGSWPTSWKATRFCPAHTFDGPRDMEGGEAADDADAGESIRELSGASKCVRAATGDAQEREPVRLQSRGQLDDIVGPVEQGSAPLKA
jgi:hypothetical protein